MAENRAGTEATTGASEPAGAKTKKTGSLPALRAELKRWAHLVDEPSRWSSLEASEQREVGERLRDFFFEMSARKKTATDADRPGQALVAAIEPAPTAHVEGLAVSFFPAGRFRSVRHVDEAHVDEALRPLFARPKVRGGQLLTAFVDPAEFSFRTFENIVPLDRYFARQPLSFAMTDPAEIGPGRCSFTLAAPGETRQALAQLDELGLYVAPLNASSRGGTRFIFHSERLSEALTEALRDALPASMTGAGRFSHVNPVFRCNRFEPGDEKFHRHLDSPYFDRNRKLVSRHTVLIYLTGGRGSPALRFTDGVALDAIEAMTVVVFDQSLEHEGSSYDDGRKVFLRSELIFEVDSVVDHPGLGQLFAKATYLTGESLFAPALSRQADAYYNRVAAAHWTGDVGPSGAGEPWVHRSFRGVHFVANGYDFWFPKGVLSLAECAALTLLDFFNAQVDGTPFRSLCTSEVVTAGEPGWVERLLDGCRESPDGKVFSPLDPDALLPPVEDIDEDEGACCPFHAFEEPASASGAVAKACKKARKTAKLGLAASPVVVMGQTLLLDPSRFVVEESRIQVLSARALAPVNFASCQGSIDGASGVGVQALLEVLQPLVPPILFAESEGHVHLMFDFFRNSWMVDAGQRTVPVPVALDMEIGELAMRGAHPWEAAAHKCSGPDGLATTAGVRWWLGRPVVTMVKGTRVDASDPTTKASTLSALLEHKALTVRVAAAANPNLPFDSLLEQLDPWDPEMMEEDEEDGRSEVTVAAWQNPSMPLAMLANPSRDYAKGALSVLLWLEHYHSVPRAFDDDTDVGEQVKLWAGAISDSPAWSREQAIVRDFAHLLAGLLGLPWGVAEA